MAYNGAGNSGCRIGNWVEQGRLEELEQEEKTGSYNRVIHHDMHTRASEYRSTMQASLCDPKQQKNQFRGHETGPRAAMHAKRFLQEALEEEANAEADKEARLAQGGHSFSVTSREAFVAPTAEFRRAHVVRKTAPRAAVRREALYAKLQGAATGGNRGNQGEDEDEDGAMDLEHPVTIYTQRLVEGAFFVTPSTSHNPFSRNTGFSNDVEDGTKYHLDGDDSPAAAPRAIKQGAAGAVREHAGAHMVQQALLKQLQVALAETAKTPHAIQAVVSRHVTGDALSLQQVEGVLRELSGPLNHRQEHAVARYLAGSSPEALLHALLAAPELEPAALAPSAGRGRLGAADAHHYVVTVVLQRCPNQEQLDFSVPKSLSRAPLVLPQDAPVVKAILRKQGIVVNRVLKLALQ